MYILIIINDSLRLPLINHKPFSKTPRAWALTNHWSEHHEVSRFAWWRSVQTVRQKYETQDRLASRDINCGRGGIRRIDAVIQAKDRLVKPSSRRTTGFINATKSIDVVGMRSFPSV